MKSDLLREFEEIKSSANIPFYDAHTHPYDVLGVTDTETPALSSSSSVKRPTILEHLDFHPISLWILEKLFFYFPSYIKKEIFSAFRKTAVDHLRTALAQAHLDAAAILSLYPYCPPDALLPQFQNVHFAIPVGSIDVHHLAPFAVEEEIVRLREKFQIKGIKLHPNIQRFYPWPEYNSAQLGAVLVKVYEVAEKYGLFIIFHTGRSYLLDHRGQFEKVSYGLLEHFFSSNFSNSVFELTKAPIVLAHLGHYNERSFNVDLLHRILDNHKHVYLDTSGISAKFVASAIENFGPERIVFGSDFPYFSIEQSLIRLLRTLKLIRGIDFHSAVRYIFGQNMHTILYGTAEQPL